MGIKSETAGSLAKESDQVPDSKPDARSVTKPKAGRQDPSGPDPTAPKV